MCSFEWELFEHPHLFFLLLLLQFCNRHVLPFSCLLLGIEENPVFLPRWCLTSLTSSRGLWIFCSFLFWLFLFFTSSSKAKRVGILESVCVVSRVSRRATLFFFLFNCWLWECEDECGIMLQGGPEESPKYSRAIRVPQLSPTPPPARVASGRQHAESTLPAAAPAPPHCIV